MKILDTTLRDGSYSIDFAFTAEDTRSIARSLQQCGIPFIELGHGIGLGASEKAGYPVAKETDESYMRAAAEVLEQAQWGMFAIVGIVTFEQINMAKAHGMDFIRIGVAADDVEGAKPFVEHAKKLGMYVAVNFMKSYMIPPEHFSRQVVKAQEFGADVAYLVDSAGGMLPSEVERYVSCIRDVSSIPLAFHGHNNLGLGMANALKCVELNLEMVDTSLQGMGRSAGNVATEQFVAMLEKMNVDHGLDLLGLMNVSEEKIRPYMTDPGIDSVDVVCGMAGFHSSYMSTIQKFSKQYRVDPRELIVAVCQVSQAEAPEALVESKARELRNKSSRETLFTNMGRYFGDEQSNL